MKPPLVWLSCGLDRGVQGLGRACEYWQINQEPAIDAGSITSPAVTEDQFVYFKLIQHEEGQRADLYLQ
jgi:hypothetical protein